MGIDVSRISKTDQRILAKAFLELFERDWNDPVIRAKYEKQQKEKEKKDKKI